MAPEFKIFHGVGAVVAQVKSNTKFSVLAVVDDGKFVDFSATARMFEIDLDATPGMQTFAGSAIKCDDRGVDENNDELPLEQSIVAFRRGRGTTFGSGTLKDMMSGAFVGTVYIEHEHFKGVRAKAIAPKPWPPPGTLQLYQLTSVAYSPAEGNGSRKGHRYHGYRGTVTDVKGESFTILFHDQQVTGPFIFTLDDADQYDNDPPSDAVGNAPSIAEGPIAPGKTGALFVALPFAAKLGIDGGKLPIGLGQDGPLAPQRQAKELLPPVLDGRRASTPRINASVASNDVELGRVMENVHGELTVSGALGGAGLEGQVKPILSDRAAANDGCMLDLIAHAAGGVLQFGDWLIDDKDEKSEILRSSWNPLKPKSIRLLGCATAGTPAGLKAMRHLAEVFQVPVFGTTVPLFSRDFEEDGLSARARLKLFKVDSPPPLEAGIAVDAPAQGNDVPSANPPCECLISDVTVLDWFRWLDPVTTTDAGTVFEQLRPETLEEATRDVRYAAPAYRWSVKRFAAEDRQRLFGQLARELATAPGLLAVPDRLQPDSEFEALFPAEPSSEGPRYFRATILLGARFVRLYPIGVPDGVILRSKAVLRLDGGVEVPLAASHAQKV